MEFLTATANHRVLKYLRVHDGDSEPPRFRVSSSGGDSCTVTARHRVLASVAPVRTSLPREAQIHSTRRSNHLVGAFAFSRCWAATCAFCFSSTLLLPCCVRSVASVLSPRLRVQVVGRKDKKLLVSPSKNAFIDKIVSVPRFETMLSER